MQMDVGANRLRDPVDQRRGGKRHATVLLIGKVRQREADAACLVHDISRHGLMARFTELPVVGETILIEVRGLPEIAATVRWVRGLKAGVEFAQPQDLDRVFCLKGDDGTVARTPRFALHTNATLRLGGQPMPAAVLDISPGGVKMIAAEPVQPGQAGQVMLPDVATPLFGSVCWTREDRFGFRFATPLPLADLSRLLGA